MTEKNVVVDLGIHKFWEGPTDFYSVDTPPAKMIFNNWCFVAYPPEELF